MPQIAKTNRSIILAVTTALASTMLAGCATGSAAPASLSASDTSVALAKGETTEAIGHAEATVLADPRNADYRAMLGAVYMEAGRFPSAAQSFADAMELGDETGRTALSYALAQVAAGQHNVALSTLNDYRSAIDASDLGLALSLAGRPEQGVHVLGNALRSGQATAKVRQNLAYSYALMGDWRSARLMAAEDVPADQINQRIAEWAETVGPQNFHTRIANLLNVPIVADTGQPAHLALTDQPTDKQMAAAIASSPVLTANGELPPSGIPMVTQEVASASPTKAVRPVPVSVPDNVTVAKTIPAKPATFAKAFATDQKVRPAKIASVSQAVVQPLPARTDPKRAKTASSKPKTVNTASAKTVAPKGNHLVQLGSFQSEASAKRAWEIYQKRYPKLGGYEMVITQAKVRGKTYYRVSAGGMQSRTATAMCSTIKAKGQGCITWAANTPLPGAVDRNARMASR